MAYHKGKTRMPRGLGELEKKAYRRLVGLLRSQGIELSGVQVPIALFYARNAARRERAEQDLKALADSDRVAEKRRLSEVIELAEKREFEILQKLEAG